jgi:hypothetical protein
MNSHLFLALTVCSPSLLVKTVVEVIGDVSTRFSPGFIFYIFNRKLESGLSIDRSNCFELFNVELAAGKFLLVLSVFDVVGCST